MVALAASKHTVNEHMAATRRLPKDWADYAPPPTNEQPPAAAEEEKKSDAELEMVRHATGTTADWPFTAGSCGGGSLEVAKRCNRAANVFVERSVIPVQELKDRLRREQG